MVIPPLPLAAGYDPLWGAGKLRLRALDAAGLDDPYGADWGSVCVDQGDNVVIAELDDMPTGVDVLKVVLWWYDDRHDTTLGSSHDKVDLYLWDNPFLPFATDESNDNKKRLFWSGMTGGEDYVITAVGRSVTSDTSGCGTNSMRVYYAWFYESSARETSEGLDNVRTED